MCAKLKTGTLAGMERKAIKAIEAAAEEYIEKRDGRMALLKQEVEAKTKLCELMHKHEQSVYSFEDSEGETVTVELSSGKEKLKVKKKGAEEEEEDGD